MKTYNATKTLETASIHEVSKVIIDRPSKLNNYDTYVMHLNIVDTSGKEYEFCLFSKDRTALIPEMVEPFEGGIRASEHIIAFSRK